METETNPCRCNFGLYLVVFARYVVLASTAITTYCLCYLVDQHRKHYCTWGYGTHCTAEQIKNIEVPWAEVIFITACVLATLESMFSTFHLIHSRLRRPDHKLLLITSTPCSIIFGIAWSMFYNLPTVILPCPPGPNDPGRDVRLAPETYDCCIALGVLIAGGIALVFQSLITLIAVVAVASSQLGKNSRPLVEVTSGEKGDDGEREALLVF